MATLEKGNVEKTIPEKVVPEKVITKPAESEYTAEEFADNCEIFGTYREVVVIALRQARKDRFTLSEAKRIVEKFKNKEVK